MRRVATAVGGGGGGSSAGGLPVYASDADGGKYALRAAGGSSSGWALNGVSLRSALMATLLLGALTIAAFQLGARGAAATAAAATRGTGTASAAAAVAPIAEATSFPAPHLRNLVLVAGHAVYTGVDFHLATREDSWFLEPYQQVEGEARSFVDHIRLGAALAARDPSALLLFSGGQTRSAAGPRSEGLSYWVVAEAAGWFPEETSAAAREAEAERGGDEAAQRAAADGAVASVRARAFTEEHARDSFENLMFGLCRFYEVTGSYPHRVTVVSYTLKQRRFEEAHRAALRFPRSRFSFVGTPIPPAAVGAQEGEARTVAGFVKDPYGCDPRGELAAKRTRRDPFAVGPPHPTRCPAMAELLTHCEPEQFKGGLPWGVVGDEEGVEEEGEEGVVAAPGADGEDGGEAAAQQTKKRKKKNKATTATTSRGDAARRRNERVRRRRQ